jgi:predicted aldo/keto reductase-like oxidoreductase
VVGAGLGIAGAAHGRPAQEQPAVEAGGEKLQIRGYRDLGGTGYKVSDLGFGNAYMQDPAILEYAMERGINYVDTARQYFDMEVVIGKLFPQKRDKLFVTTKLMPELVTADVSVATLMDGIEDSLQRLNTDYIDACLIHSVGDPNLGDETRIQNPSVAEAFQKAKQQGKIRIWGASAHGPKMVEDFTWLLDNTDIGMIMPGMNLLTKGLEPVLAKARQKGVAVVAMKSLSMGRKIDYSEYMTEGRTARQALIKWMLAQPNIDTISITMRTIEDIDELVAVSGNPAMTPKEKETLQGYRLRLERDYCRPGCDGCLGTCPHDVPIYDILRYRMYFNNYGLEKYAMGLYASLPRSKQADRCAGCTGPCERSCPYQLAIRSKLLQAHAELTV